VAAGASIGCASRFVLRAGVDDLARLACTASCASYGIVRVQRIVRLIGSAWHERCWSPRHGYA
jgi:hypothetical protein